MWYKIKHFFWKYIVDPIVSVVCFCYGFILGVKWLIFDKDFRQKMLEAVDPIAEEKVNEHFGITKEV